jgi:pimeloyl-ACP methyl ester carboxylesterase
MPRIDSLLSARLFLTPQLVEGKLYFLSNMSGRLSLYVMDARGSVPIPLLPPQIALQNPHLIGGDVFSVFPLLKKIVVMIDQDGDENYQPTTIPLEGGDPEPAFDGTFARYRCHLHQCDPLANALYIAAESRTEARIETYKCDLAIGETTLIGAGPWGPFVAGVNAAHTKAILTDEYTTGDTVISLWSADTGERKVLHGTSIEERAEGQTVPLNGFGSACFTKQDRGVLITTSLFADTYSLAYFPLDNPQNLKPVTIEGVRHQGVGELESLEHLHDDLYLLGYNIDGCSWRYEGTFDQAAARFTIARTICGAGTLSNGVLESARYDKAGDRYAISFSTAVSPTQIYTIEGADRSVVTQLTGERILGIPADWLSAGEDASFTSHDGLRVSARLYLPAASLGFTGKRPLVYYIHGGPQGQERPDFTWFSMPIIQFLTIQGFAVFVPNVRGSTGYGLSYTKHVDRDWGGQDRLDHVHAMGLLARDARIDTGRAGVVGRSYGGYMTLTLATRHPELWQAAVDMFGPYDLEKFMDAIPATWKPYFAIAVGDPIKDKDFLAERSPRTYIDHITCPLLVIQGKNDPRVVEAESRAVVERLRAKGKQVEYLMFENEGHDVLKHENRITCYNAITDFFKEHLRP